MKTLHIFVFLTFSLLFRTQAQNASGYYAGEFSTDTVCIRVVFDLNKNGTYKINLAYNFIDYCLGKGKDTLLFEGRWAQDQNWVFLYPFNKGIDIFYQYESRSRKDRKIIAAHQEEYMVPLKISWEDSCPRIYFRINSDCFKDAWKFYYIERLSCQGTVVNVAK